MGRYYSSPLGFEVIEQEGGGRSFLGSGKSALRSGKSAEMYKLECGDRLGIAKVLCDNSLAKTNSS